MRLRCFSALALAASLMHGGPAAAITLTLLTNDAGALNHYPGADGLIGDADDLVTANRTALHSSGPNSLASYSYNAFDFVGDGSSTDVALPSGMNAVTFLQGTVSVDPDIAVSGGGSLVTGLEVSGTEPFFGHGAYTASVTGVNSGSYDPVTGAASINFGFETSLLAGTTQAVDFELTGNARLIGAPDFGILTGNDYLDTVLLPLASSMGAGWLFFAQVGGTLPASTNGTGFASFPSMPVQGVIVAMAPVPSPPAVGLFAFAICGLWATGRRGKHQAWAGSD